MSAFKPGDKVRVAKFVNYAGVYPDPTGLVGTVAKVGTTQPFPYFVNLITPPDDDKFYPELFAENELEAAA